MRFSNKQDDFSLMVESLALIVSLGAIFLQIWILFYGIEAYFTGRQASLWPAVFLSGLAFTACCVGVFLTGIGFGKGSLEGRTKTYRKGTIKEE